MEDGNNRNLIAMNIPELESFVDEVLPIEKTTQYRGDLMAVEIDVLEYIVVV